jgi:hypothetical protein
MVKMWSASVSLNDFPRIESNFVYTNLDMNVFLSKYATYSGREASTEQREEKNHLLSDAYTYHYTPTQ